MKTFTMEVTQTVVVSLDEAKFDDDFMQEFRESFYPFWSLEDHAAHIAQLVARGLADRDRPSEFVEGYGPLSELGISATIESTFTESIAA